MTVAEARERIQRFANKHKVIFEDEGTVGFGRPCVGLIRGNGYIDHNPLHGVTYRPIEAFEDERLYPPNTVPDAYHKHDCLAVLIRDENRDEAILQLAAWLDDIESKGEVEIVEFATGAQGYQAVISGIVHYAIRYKNE